MNIQQLIATINRDIKQNGLNEITGPILNSVLTAIVNAFNNGKQDTLTGGTNIKNINGSSILSAGNLELQPKLTAGTNITIENNVISATGGSGGGTWGSITGTLSNQTDLQNALNGKQSTLSSGVNIKTINGASILGSGNLSVSAEMAESITHRELVLKAGSNALVVGKWYRITDYVTKVKTGFDYDSAEHPYDILVQAISTNQLSEDARAIQHSGDTYFANCNLSAWRLKYHLANDTELFEWAVSGTTGKGVVYGMIDEYNNDLPFDFKNIRFNQAGDYKYTFGVYYGGSFVDMSVTDVLNDDGALAKPYNNKIYPSYYNDDETIFKRIIPRFVITADVDSIYPSSNNNIFPNCKDVFINGDMNNSILRARSYNIIVNGSMNNAEIMTTDLSCGNLYNCKVCLGVRDTLPNISGDGATFVMRKNTENVVVNIVDLYE